MSERQLAALAAGRTRRAELLASGELVNGGRGGGTRRRRDLEAAAAAEETLPAVSPVDAAVRPTAANGAPPTLRLDWPDPPKRPAPSAEVTGVTAGAEESPATGEPPAVVASDSGGDPGSVRVGGFLSGFLEGWRR